MTSYIRPLSESMIKHVVPVHVGVPDVVDSCVLDDGGAALQFLEGATSSIRPLSESKIKHVLPVHLGVPDIVVDSSVFDDGGPALQCLEVQLGSNYEHGTTSNIRPLSDSKLEHGASSNIRPLSESKIEQEPTSNIRPLSESKIKQVLPVESVLESGIDDCDLELVDLPVTSSVTVGPDVADVQEVLDWGPATHVLEVLDWDPTPRRPLPYASSRYRGSVWALTSTCCSASPQVLWPPHDGVLHHLVDSCGVFARSGADGPVHGRLGCPSAVLVGNSEGEKFHASLVASLVHDDVYAVLCAHISLQYCMADADQGCRKSSIAAVPVCLAVQDRWQFPLGCSRKSLPGSSYKRWVAIPRESRIHLVEKEMGHPIPDGVCALDTLLDICWDWPKSQLWSVFLAG